MTDSTIGGAATANTGGVKSAARRQHTERWQRFVLWAATRLGGRVQTMPRHSAMAWATRIGRVSYRLAKKQRRIASRNLQLAQFPRPDATDAERAALIEGVFVHFSKVFVDFLRSPTLDARELTALRSVITECEGLEHIQKAQAANHGVLILASHFGNWELLGRFVTANGLPLTVIAREPENGQFGDFVRHIRNSAGMRVLPKGGSAREVFSLLKRGEGVGLLPDQNSGDVFVPFFGVPCGTVAGPASFALRTGAALVPCFCLRKPDDTYKFIALPPIDTQPTGDKERDTTRIMTEVNRVLESMIRQYPDQWLWLHNRWKSAFEEKNYHRAWRPDVPGARAAYEAAWERWGLLPFLPPMETPDAAPSTVSK